ncbi:hypothetical protein [Bacillus wiedmannii]|uniref:hypothetical protein n=1 Tax=Bacillus wiedmannii TaxID=1890302 RepID=UPI0015E167D6|nr:hypothetical protein [Bacillus wiedmannii]MBG9829693.1 hypothetical protein [Bacillus wiedmannii]UOB95767.1 hypothetical protein BTI679_31100 [Bacillus wiedmannii]
MKLSNAFRVTEVKNKTQSVFFKDLKVGDEFSLVYDVNGGYTNAPTISIYQNGKRVGSRYASQLNNVFNELDGILSVEPTGVHLSQNHFDSLASRALKLDKLEAYGVDNWSGYGMAMSDEEGFFE